MVVFNPLSGRGRAARAARAIESHLVEAGIGARLRETGPASIRTNLAQDLRTAGGERSALVVVGGDGTVLSCAEASVQSHAPIYHVPMGTENLFSRNFAMTTKPDALLRALEAHQARSEAGEPSPLIDVGMCNERPFLIMASTGFDANVVHRLDRTRRGSISHLSYVPHILGECIAPRSKPITIRVDGQEVVSGRRGLAVIANSPHYAMRANPARNASMTDGLLDLCFMPSRHPVTGMLWLQRAKWGMHMRARRCIRVRGERIEITAHGGGLPFQLDGEAPTPLANGQAIHAGATTPITASIRRAALPVLVPPL